LNVLEKVREEVREITDRNGDVANHTGVRIPYLFERVMGFNYNSRKNDVERTMGSHKLEKKEHL
jgi:hypothetical protein